MGAEVHAMPDSLTRQEMYDLVWSWPRAELAEKLGINEMQLRLLCRFHRVPLPTNQYWRQLGKGAKPDKVALPTVDKAWLETITVPPRAAEEPSFAGDALPAAQVGQIQEEEEEEEAGPASAEPPATRRGSNRTQQTVPRTRVRRPHSAVAESVELLRATKPINDVVYCGGGNLLFLWLGRNSVERAIFILDRLARALEKLEVSVRIRDGALEVSKARHHLRLRFSEKSQDAPYHPTDAERRRQAVVERQRRTPPFLWIEDAFPSSLRVPMGTLMLAVDPGPQPDRQRQNWRDNKYATLEAQIDSIANSLNEWLDYLCEGERAEARKVRIAMRAQENRRLADARAERERQRSNFLAQVTERALTADKIRTWIAVVGEPEEPETQRLLAWARAELARLEGTFHPKRFAAEIRRRELFPDEDPLAPLPDDPDAEGGT